MSSKYTSSSTSICKISPFIFNSQLKKWLTSSYQEKTSWRVSWLKKTEWSQTSWASTLSLVVSWSIRNTRPSMLLTLIIMWPKRLTLKTWCTTFCIWPKKRGMMCSTAWTFSKMNLSWRSWSSVWVMVHFTTTCTTGELLRCRHHSWVWSCVDHP